MLGRKPLTDKEKARPRASEPAWVLLKIIFVAMQGRLYPFTGGRLARLPSATLLICHFRRVAPLDVTTARATSRLGLTVVNGWRNLAFGQTRARPCHRQTSHRRTPAGPAQRPESDPRSH